MINKNVLNKKTIFVSIISLIILFIFLVLSFTQMNRIESNSEYFFFNSYGGYSKTFNLIILLTLIVHIFLIAAYTSKITNTSIILNKSITVVLIICISGYFVTQIKEFRSTSSYTIQINDYGKFDTNIKKELTGINIPNKKNVLNYEYSYRKDSSIYGTKDIFSFYVKVPFTNEYKPDLDYKLVNNTDYELSNYNIYINNNEFSNNKIVNYNYIFIDKEERHSIYILTNDSNLIFKRNNNNNCIHAFLSNQRDNPFYVLN